MGNCENIDAACFGAIENGKRKPADRDASHPGSLLLPCERNFGQKIEHRLYLIAQASREAACSAGVELNFLSQLGPRKRMELNPHMLQCSSSSSSAMTCSAAIV
ncbi:hypothetical protein BH23GEM3_BH23GEM3_23960 [soil metagenome]